MYHVQGGDHREYGPLDADQVRQWIREHRLDRSSPARRADATEWQTLGAFAEFSADLSGAGLVASVPPQPDAAPNGREQALASVKAPAIAMLVTGILNALFTLPNLFRDAAAQQQEVLEEFERLKPQLNEEMRRVLEPLMQQVLQMSDGPSAMISAVLSLAISAMMVVGGLKLMKLQGLGWVMTAAILALLPCSSCCCIGIPVGIWTLIAINRATVKPHFR
jgi:TRAP-type C4-dicarboxylate transport system permease small subunit